MSSQRIPPLGCAACWELPQRWPGDSQLSCPILTEDGMCRQILLRHPNNKSYENLFSGFRVVTCGKTDGRANVAKLIGVT
jgi:hypothetical protein